MRGTWVSRGHSTEGQECTVQSVRLAQYWGSGGHNIGGHNAQYVGSGEHNTGGDGGYSTASQEKMVQEGQGGTAAEISHPQKGSVCQYILLTGSPGMMSLKFNYTLKMKRTTFFTFKENMKHIWTC